MREYTIIRKPEPMNWDAVPVAAMDCQPWRTPVENIAAEARLCYDENYIYVFLKAKEENIRAEETGPLGSPCEDSCLEFFFSPIEGDQRYFNIEFNPVSCMYLGFGADRYKSVRLLPEDVFKPEVRYTEDGWQITYAIPVEFVQRFAPDFRAEPGKTIRGNFYKCGDLTPKRHYLVWNRIGTEAPDYHRPEYFGLLRFA